MQHSKKFLAFFGALLCTLPLLMAPTGGFPSRPRFQSVGVNAAAPATPGFAAKAASGANMLLDLTGASTGEIFLCTSSTANLCQGTIAAGDSLLGVANTLHMSNGTTDWFTGNTTTIQFPTATTLTVAGVSVLPASATSTGTATGCTTAPTVGVHLNKIGNVAVISVDAILSCTSNATTFSLTSAVPAAFQPARTQFCVGEGQDNSVNAVIFMAVAAGSTTLTLTPVAAAGFTAAGTKAVYGGVSCAYNLN